MSRSNPTENTPHPCTRWFEWDGSNGTVCFYDKASKKNITVADGFTFILLDELASVRGWHQPSGSGIVSNEVRDTTKEPLLVRAFKGGKIAEGFYREIKDRVSVSGGKFTATAYLAYKDATGLALGALQLSGSALNSWVEFKKANRGEDKVPLFYQKAVRVKGFVEAKNGNITYRTPVFHLADISEETNQKAIEIDKRLQEYLKGYFQRTHPEQAKSAPHPAEAPQPDAPADEPPMSEPEPEQPAAYTPPDDDVPF